MINGHPAGHCTEDHYAFNAQIYDAGAFGDKRTDRAENERGRDTEGRRPEAGVPEDSEDIIHGEFYDCSAARQLAWPTT